MIVTTSAKRTSRSITNVPDPVVLIRSSAYSSLPSPGNRVGTGDASNMPTIQAATSYPAIQCEAGAHHYRLCGLQIKAPTSVLQNSIVKIGGGEATVADFPTDITIDRCIILGDPTNGARRGVSLDAIRGAIIDSYIANIWEASVDSIAVWAYNTPGPIKVVNNYCESGSENIMFGGATPTITNGDFPSDVEVRRNYCFKPLDWEPLGSARYVKNLMELKYGRRFLIEGNVFQNNWYSAQSGLSFLLTPRNEVGNSNWVYISDITLRKNKFLNVGSGLNFAGHDSNWIGDPTKQIASTTRVDVQDNLIELKDVASAGDNLRGLSYSGGANNVSVVNNTIVIPTWPGIGSGGMFAISDQLSYNGSNAVWRDNVFTHATYGLYSGSGVGNPTLASQWSSYSFTYNVVIGGSSGDYPSGNFFPANNTATGFTDFAGGDYSLTGASAYHNAGSDGTDPGADFAALNAATLHTQDGQWGSEPETYQTESQVNAELPRTYINTTFVTPTGNLWTATNTSSSSVAGTGTGNRTGCSLTYALANCAIGDIIELTAGATYTVASSTSLTLRAI